MYTSIDVVTCYDSTWNDNVVIMNPIVWLALYVFAASVAIVVRGYVRLLNRDLHFSFHVYTRAISALTHLLTIWGVVYYFLLPPRL